MTHPPRCIDCRKPFRREGVRCPDCRRFQIAATERAARRAQTPSPKAVGAAMRFYAPDRRRG